jgi:signal transduction histidine kinase
MDKKGEVLSVDVHELLSEDSELTLLYVEDNKDVRESMQDLLVHYCSDLEVAVDGQDALEKYEAHYQKTGKYFDIVLTDINMPRMSGIKLIEKIREINERQIIVVISAHNELNILLRLIDLEISNFLVKPIEIDQFETVFGRVINIVHQRRKYHKLHEDLRRTKILAEKATQHKSQFLANMFHEIRTPLNAIIGFITLLRENETDEKKLKYLDIITNSSDSLLQIINDILDVSKIESGKLEIEPHNFNPYKDLIPVAELFQAKAAEKNIVLKVKYNNDMPELLYGDSLRIKQIFSNLLSNAIKFTPEGSEVKCVVWYKKGKLNIIVKDRGIGISEEQQKKIFQPFTQADGSIVRKYGGTGLGLTISMELSRLLGGEITLRSKEGKGSVFRLSLPVPIGVEKKKEEEEIITSLDGHILVVEDYEANRMFVGIILENAGLTYEMAHDGVEAIEKFKTGKYDLILMDENMPKLNGTEATKEILRMEEEQGLAHTPIVSLTANALKGDREIFLAAWFDDYLSKPIDPQKLLKTMKRLLNTCALPSH